MAESTGHKTPCPVVRRKQTAKRFDRSSSEHRNKTSGKTNFHRSQSVQRKTLTENQQQQQQQEQQEVQNVVELSTMEKALLEDSSFPNFFVRVNCPFCLEVQNNKTDLVKHLDGNCRIKKSNSKQYSTFQILPDNSIKCNICLEERFGSVEGYFRHLYNEEHIVKCSDMIRNGKKLTEFVYCSCCYLKIPDNATQLLCHLRHKIHKARSNSLTPADFRNRGLVSVYCIYNGRRTFRCLACPPPNFLFQTPLEIIKHLKTAKHLCGTKNYSVHNVFCCFCKEEFGVSETPFHFGSPEHWENEKIAADGIYEVCLYCEFSTGDLIQLSRHMRLECDEIKRIRQGFVQQKPPNESSAGEKPEERCKLEKKPKNSDRCILVKDDVDVVPVTRMLKQFGKIKSVSQYGHGYFLIEFEEESSIQDIYLLKNLIRIDDKKVCIKFLQEVQGKSIPD